MDQLVKLLDKLLIPCCHIITIMYDLNYSFLLIKIGAVMYVTHSVLISEHLSEFMGL